MKIYAPKSSMTILGGVTLRTSAVAFVVTIALKGSGRAASIARGGVMRVYDSEEMVAPMTYPSTHGCLPRKSMKATSSSDSSNSAIGNSWGFRSCCNFRMSS
ncbi:hypothetical protein HAX54_051086 [Datura stramonium]|uniref:Secreted protein n=1 Tax=Datura stramonium TaxID=4076 RepID=A0ABS8WLZ4_DATST|nr:hypothetical protein [Datura stramonium]